MTPAKPPGPYLDEINARIKEAEEWGNEPEAKHARWQKRWIERRYEQRMRRNERDEGRER